MKEPGASSSEMIDQGRGVPDRITIEGTMSLVISRSVKVTQLPYVCS